MDSGRSRTPTGTELDASYMGYVRLTRIGAAPPQDFRQIVTSVQLDVIPVVP